MKKSIGLIYLKLFLHLIIVGLVAGGCANIVPPSGGARDVQKPQIKSVEPANYSLHFDAKKVNINFDEFFNLDNPAQQIIVSPPLEKQPDYVITGKKLIIKFRNNFQPNTTYNINFGNALKDYNEGNVQDSFKYVFSTGDYLDSASISGRVLQAIDNVAVEGFGIMLYEDISDSVVFKGKPLYIGKTNRDGLFKIENIKKGSYKLVAFKDEDFDYLYDPEIEAIAFPDSLVELGDTSKIKNFLLHSFSEEPSQTILLDVINPQLGLIKFIYNKPILNIQFNADVYSKRDIAIVNESKDTVSYYYSDYTKSSTIFYITTNNTIKDTFTKELFYIKESELKDNKISIYNGPISVKMKEKSDITHDIYKPYFLSLTRPFKVKDSTKIKLLEDTTLLAVNATFTLDKKDSRRLEINYKWTPGMAYQIAISKGAVVDVFGVENEDISETFKIMTKENYGSIIIHNKLAKDNNFLLKILNEKDQIIYQNYVSMNDKSKTIIFSNLPSGYYKISVIEDTNRNKKWDSGNYILHRQAEKIYTFGDKVFLKPGWDADIDIVL